ncbi:MAG: LysM peptidoglycan-binding domain-containing C40 family peptidase [Actinomycetota bacterium]|nr:LysM peptidoglycan-binding domain-containing C40 family peptidase [Actinomycetota bacterium]
MSRASARAPRHAAVKSNASASARAPRHAAVQLSGKTYTVTSGDTLSTIAKELDVAGGWKQLWAANPAVGDPELIYVGQELQIPAPSPSSPSAASKSSAGTVSSAAVTSTAAATSRASAGTKSSAVTAADSGAGSSAGAASSAASTNLPPNPSLAARAVAFARAHIGDPYVFAGAGPHSWDCSGLTMAAYASVGVDIGIHSATAQYNYANSQGRLVSYANRQPGDLLFYTDGGGVMYHVAIYSGNGMMIEAPHAGVNVREVPVRTNQLVGQVARRTA